MGAQQAIAEAFDHYAIIAACITDGAYRTSPGHVVHAGKGVSRIGALNEKGRQAESAVLEQLQQMDLVTEHCRTFIRRYGISWPLILLLMA